LTHVNSNGGNNGSIYAEAVVELQKLPASVSLGGTVSVSFPLNSAADATRIPRPCLAGDGQSVFQLDEKRGTVVRRPLEIGLRGNDFVEVLSGIAPGQHLVMPLTGTPANLKDGTSVRVVLHER
jgi:multidrug efflux pump subunit AcrA (membrane-fusion protein)